MRKWLVSSIGILVLCSATVSQKAQEAQPKPLTKQYIYVLKLIPRLLVEKNWTEEDGRIVGRHFRRLKDLHKDGKVVLAGRTLNDSEPSSFGIVILQVSSEEEARKIMEEDDAVKEKIMTAQLFPFSVALR